MFKFCENFLSCEAAIGIIVEILFCVGFESLSLTNGDAKKIATDSPTRAEGKAWRGNCPNNWIKKPHLERQGF